MFILACLTSVALAVPAEPEEDKTDDKAELRLYVQSTALDRADWKSMIVEVVNLCGEERHLRKKVEFMDQTMKEKLGGHAVPKNGTWMVVIDCWAPEKNFKGAYCGSGGVIMIKMSPESTSFLKFAIPEMFLGLGKCEIQARLITDGDIVVARTKKVTIECVDSEGSKDDKRDEK